MANIAGVEVALPTINITGILSSSWIYVLIVGLIGFIIIVAALILFFFKTYTKKVEFYENIAGMGYINTITTRARVFKVGLDYHVLKTIAGGYYLTAYGRKVGKNKYMFVRGSDGYWYNAVHGDFDTKLAMLDIEPVDRDIRGFHTAMAKFTKDNYDSSMKKLAIGIGVGIFIVLVIAIIGGWIIAGRISEGLAQQSEGMKILADALKSNVATSTASGLVAA